MFLTLYRTHVKISKNWLTALIFLSGLYMEVAGQTKNLVVIDPLASGNFKDPPENVIGNKIMMLPGEGNPVTIIATELSNSSYDQIHIYVLTKPGSIIFDEINIVPGNSDEYAAGFRSWKAGLNTGCKIILHSEDLLSDPGGEVITGKIGEFTGCKVTVTK